MPTPEDIRKWAESQGTPTPDEMAKSFRIIQESMNSMALDSVRAEGERIRHKAQVDQATIKQPEEIRLLREEFRQARQESRKDRLVNRLTLLVAVLTLVASVLVPLLTR